MLAVVYQRCVIDSHSEEKWIDIDPKEIALGMDIRIRVECDGHVSYLHADMYLRLAAALDLTPAQPPPR